LEEAAFGHLFPQEKQKIMDTYAHLGGDARLAEIIEQYKDGVGAILEDEVEDGIGVTIQGRRKSYYSVWRKVTKDDRPYDLPDFLGIRAIVDSDNDEIQAANNCYVVSGILSQYFEPEAGRYKDYIYRPKPNGYRSLHLARY
jgi:GTP pyrophosphokinase